MLIQCNERTAWERALSISLTDKSCWSAWFVFDALKRRGLERRLFPPSNDILEVFTPQLREAYGLRGMDFSADPVRRRSISAVISDNVQSGGKRANLTWRAVTFSKKP